MIHTGGDLDVFVRMSDELGGPERAACSELWRTFSYQPQVNVDQNLDPFSDIYAKQQMTLYEELAARTYDPETTEMTDLDALTPEAYLNLIEGPNPYGLRRPSSFVDHYLRLGLAVKQARLSDHPTILDMGAGWGLSSEFFATLGADVTAIDINPQFVRLIRARQERSGLPIQADVGEFENYAPQQEYDAVFFYECLHHARVPWDIIDRMAKVLKPGGSIVFAGEPVNDIWWHHWGMRLDPLSVYCIRKYGWYESGWSRPFISRCLARAGLLVDYADSPVLGVGSICVARRWEDGTWLDVDGVARVLGPSGWGIGAGYITGSGRDCFAFYRPDSLVCIEFVVRNNRPATVGLKITSEDTILYDGIIETGENRVTIDLPKIDHVNLKFVSDTWCPAEEIGNGDDRIIGVFIDGATLLQNDSALR